jgi:hypothetical protein
VFSNADGRGVEMDRYQAIMWWVRAAEKGAPFALSNIARAYSTGNALPKDSVKAMFWMLAAWQRMTPAQHNQVAQNFNNIVRQVSVDDGRRIGEQAQKWAPGPGSLDTVLDDARKRRDQGDTPPVSPPQSAPIAPEPASTDKSKRSA